MTAELNLLKVLTLKENLEKYLKLLNPKTLSVQTIQLLKDYQEYFKVHLTDKEIQFNKFREFFFIIQHPTMDEKQLGIYKDVIEQLQNIPLTGNSCVQIITSFEQQEFYAQLHRDLDNNVTIGQIVTKVAVFDEKMAILSGGSVESNEDMDLKAALEYTDRSKGLLWRLDCLNQHFGGGLTNGDLILLCGYVDSGKSSFVASEVSYMAEQLSGDQYILWLNTEGNWQQIVPRIYCATLNCTKEDLQKRTGSAILRYTEKMKGNRNRIKVLNYQRKSVKDIENLIRKQPPSLIVFDLLDHISGFRTAEGDSVEQYGHLYQWARTIATEICPVIAISQLNRNGNDSMYPPMTELSGSGEKKQAAATAMIMLGSQQGNDTERYLSTPKNKIGGGKGFRCPIKFDPLRSRFND